MSAKHHRRLYSRTDSGISSNYADTASIYEVSSPVSIPHGSVLTRQDSFLSDFEAPVNGMPALHPHSARYRRVSLNLSAQISEVAVSNSGRPISRGKSNGARKMGTTDADIINEIPKLINGAKRETLTIHETESFHDFAKVEETEAESKFAEGDDERTRQMRTEIVRKLLEEFDLEKTIHKYRFININNMNGNTRHADQNSSAKLRSVKKKLERLMGNDSISMDDPFYSEKLRKKFWKDYEAELDRQEEARAETERQRMRKLMRDGIISFEELQEDFNGKEKTKQHDTEKKKKKRRRKSSSKRPKSSVTCSVNERPSTVSSLELRPSYTAPPSRTSMWACSMCSSRPSSPDSQDKNNKNKQHQQQQQQHMQPAPSPDYPERLCHSAPPERSKPIRARPRYQHPLVQKMNEEQSVDGLYAIAEELIRI